MRLSKAHCLKWTCGAEDNPGIYITRQSRVRGPTMAPRMVRGGIYGAMVGPAEPTVGGTIYGMATLHC